MNHFSKYDPFSSDRFIKDGKANSGDASGRLIKPISANTFKAHTYLFPLNESEEFHDPFSEINLFLAKRIKREILREKNPRKWSRKTQSLLLKEVIPDFSRQFPGYRLGSMALQKTWNKVLYYLQTIQQKKGALKANGKLNVDYLIVENLKNLDNTQSDFHPFNTAHSLAVKIAECIAAIDGERPHVEALTKKIWSVQKHMIPSCEKVAKAPFDTIDSLDKIIVRHQLEALTQQPHLTKEELASKVKKQILNVRGLERIRNLDEIKPGLMALLSEKLYPSLDIHKKLKKGQLDEIESFIRSQLVKTKLASNIDREKKHAILATRIFFLYKLASQISLDEAQESLQAAIQYVYSLSTDSIQLNTPVLRQEVYDFIDQEISQFKEAHTKDPLKELLSTLVDIFTAAEKLPKLDTSLFPQLEIVIWKVISQQSECLEKLPGYLKKIISEQLASVHIDNQGLSFTKIVNTTLSSLKALREIDYTEMDDKIEIWAQQNEMVASLLYFDKQTPLLKLIEKEECRSIEALTQLTEKFIQKNPELSGWESQVHLRASILFKYYWYHTLKKESETNYDRYFLYQYEMLIKSEEKQFPELLLDDIQLSFTAKVPLFPFLRDHFRHFIQV